MTNSVICLLFFKADEYACSPGSDGVWGVVGAPKSMLDNGITSLTCIHCEAGIKPGTQRRGKKGAKKGERQSKEGRRDSDEREMIKKPICCLSVAETEALGKRGGWGRGREWRRIGSGGGAGVCRQSDVFNFFCC